MIASGESRAATVVLGAGGYIGQCFVARLADHPWFEPPTLIGGPRTVGRTLGEVWQLPEPPPEALAAVRLQPCRPARIAAARVRLAFSALPSGTAATLERELARRGVAVFSNAADLRGLPGIPLILPEVNASHLAVLEGRPTGSAPIVTNPNCSATGLAMALAPMVGLLAPRTVHVATYQSLSGAGYPGVPSLSIADNVIPFIDQEERKLAAETRQLLGRVSPSGAVREAAFPIVANCARVATREGHLEAVTIEAGRKPTLAELSQAIGSFDPLGPRHLPSAPHPPLLLREESDRPQPLRDRNAGDRIASRGMAVTLGRLRWEPPFLRFFLLVNNAIRGGAGGSLLNAELLRSEGGLPS